MTAKDVIKYSIDMGHEILTTYLSDMTDADLMVRAVPGMNHMAWQIGHLISAEHQMLSDTGFDMPKLPDGFAESYSKESAPSDDTAKFCAKDQYMKLLAEQRAGTMKALDASTETDLEKETPEPMQAYAKTVAAVFNIVGLHTMMHASQFVAVRRKLGKPILI